MCHNVSHSILHPFVHTSLLANVHCNESLVWFEASGFCYTINTGSSLGLLSDILLLPCVMEILQLWICRTSPFMHHMLYHCISGGDVGIGQLKPWIWAWEVAEWVSPQLSCSHTSRVSSPVVSRLAHPILQPAVGGACSPECGDCQVEGPAQHSGSSSSPDQEPLHGPWW